ncbi:MAG: type II secretion system protein GspC [Deltaproteobacteria bacterium]|nr:type II secretion system protein GspC [Deltaproteobacteria bacterium]
MDTGRTVQKAWTFVEMVLRRHPWAVTLAGLVPCAFFSASMVNHVLAANVLKANVGVLTRPGGGIGASASPERSPLTFRSRDTDIMLRRNLFDADAGCLNCPPPIVEAPDAGPEADETTPPMPCSGQLKVMGAVESDDPTWSFVFVSQGTGQPTMPYRLGHQLDGRTVASIGWAPDYGAYAILRPTSGPRCFYAQVMPPAPPAPVAAPVAAVAAVADPGDSLSQILESGITRDGANQFTLRRATVDRILENQAELMRTTRVMPHMEGGRIAGLTLFGVRPNNLLGRIGMQNSDVLTRINGLEIASPDKALEAYARLRTADHLQLSVLRNGAPVNIDFNIRQ